MTGYYQVYVRCVSGRNAGPYLRPWLGVGLSHNTILIQSTSEFHNSYHAFLRS